MKARVRLVALRVRAVLARTFARVFMTLVPPRDQALVAGLPDSEENSLVTALALARRQVARVVLVANDPAAARVQLDRVAVVLDGAALLADEGGASVGATGEQQIPGSPGEHGRAASAVVVVGKRDRGTYAAFLRSALVAYTHGLYDSPRPAGRRVHVNLWHGSGPKWNGNANQSQRIGADVLVANNTPWGSEVARALAMPAGTQLVTGNAREDVMLAAQRQDAQPGERQAGGSRRDDSQGRARLTALGLDPARPVVLWMPTFRTSARAGRVGLREGIPLGARRDAALTDPALTDPVIRELVARCAAEGVQLVLKTHRHDDDDYAGLGVRALSTADVLAAGLTLYELLGLVDAVVSDYSSVWVDYLATGRSVALHCPDLEAYESARGLNSPPLRDVAGGLFLTSPADAAELAADLAAGRTFRPDALAATAATLGVTVGPLPGGRSRADAMLDELAEIARARHGTPLGLAAPPPA